MYPVFLRMDKLNVLIVGGGYVGLEKISAMFRHCQDVHITMVAPEIRDEIVEYRKKYPTQLELTYKPFDEKDLDTRDLVIVATANNELNRSIWKQAKSRGILTNVADTPDLCDFYMASVVKKGDLKIAISSNGKSPTLTKRMRELLDEALPGEIDEILQNLSEIRDGLKGDFEEKVEKLNEITSVMKNKNTKKN